MDIKKIINEKISWMKKNPYLTAIIIALVITSLVIKLNIAHDRPIYPVGTDARSYHEDAAKFVTENQPLDNYHNPGQLIFLTFWYTLFSPDYIAGRYAMIIASFILAYYVFKIGETLVNRQVGYVAFAIALFDPFVIFYSTTLFGEMLMVMLLSIVLYYSLRNVLEKPTTKNLIIIGVGSGLLMLFKSWLGVIIPIYVFYKFLYQKKRNWELLFKELAILIAIAFAVLLPWGIYNQVNAGHFVLTNTGSSYMFFFGNNPYATVAYISNYPPEMDYLITDNGTITDRYVRNKNAVKYATNYIIENPGKTMKKMWTFFYKYWSHPNKEYYQRPLPKQNLQLGYLWVKWIFMLAGGAYLIKKSLKKQSLLLLVALATLGAYALTFYLARYKFTVIPIELVYTAVGIIILFQIILGLIRQSGTKTE